MRVIGTAGHVDHGKSTLVRRLTGIDPDRLAEEKKREMTIDLGFAWLTLPNGETLGIVDVPGHRDFIENMLAGVGGIDAVLLVIAADEGVMPQTREHLTILDLLGIQTGLIVLSKIDTVGDQEWLDLVEQEIHETTRQTTLANAEIVRISAQTGTGIQTLIERLQALLAELPARLDNGQARLPIDRVFTMAGFGTVVTGTLIGGKIRVGDEIELQPAGLRGRIRGLQSYQQSVEIAYPGSRVAVNIAGVDKQAVERGFVLTHPNQLKPTTLVGVYFRHLPDTNRDLKHNTPVKFFSGTTEANGFVRLLDCETLTPGQEGWLQLRLENPVAVSRGDRFILRYPSPGETIGGGMIVNPNPQHRWKRFQPTVIETLETQLQGSPAQRIRQAAENPEPVKRIHLQKITGFAERELEDALKEAVQQGLVLELGEGLYQAATTYHTLLNQMLEILTKFHASYPLRLGIPREELRSRLGLKNATLTLLLNSQVDIVPESTLLRLNHHAIRFTDAQQAKVEKLAEIITANPYTPPAYSEIAEMIGEDLLRALIDLDELVQIQPEIILSRTAYDEMRATTLQLIDQHGSVDAKTVRDYFNTSRKFAIGLLEHLDAIGITRRIEDRRVRK